MSFNLDDYEPVATRLARFLDAHREQFPRVITEMVHRGDTWCTFKAYLYLGEDLISTGWAEEHVTERGVNAISHVENCETSAVGRALANAGFAGSDPSRRASREEMAKVNRGAPQRSPLGSAAAKPTGLATEGQRTLLKTMASERGLEIEILPDLTFSDAQQIIQELKKTPKVK